jgi:hypothetical protein
VKSGQTKGGLAAAASANPSSFALVRTEPLLLVRADLFDHPVRLEKDRLWDREPECLRGLEVDYQLELRRLLAGRSPGFAPFKILSTNTGARRCSSTTLAP